jgi:hypothetical protein
MLVGCGKETAPKKAAAPAKPAASPSVTPLAVTDKKEAPGPREEKLAPPAPPGREKAGEEKAAGEATTAEEKKPAGEPKAVVEKKAAVEEKE